MDHSEGAFVIIDYWARAYCDANTRLFIGHVDIARMLSIGEKGSKLS